jgi:hypothetical protein
LCTYYRRYIQGFANIAKPLTRLTEEKRMFEWSPEAEAAFRSLKEALCTASVLGYQRPGEKFIVDTDASNTGISGVLPQVQDGHERVVAYFSKNLLRTERNYCATRRELLAIVKDIGAFPQIPVRTRDSPAYRPLRPDTATELQQLGGVDSSLGATPARMQLYI